MKCDSSGVAPLKKDGINYSDPTDQDDTLNVPFLSAFTKEDNIMVISTANTASSLSIQINGMKKLLLGQNPHKLVAWTRSHQDS